MSKPRRIAVLIGSLRKASYSKKIADAVEAVAPPDLSFERVEIGDLPFYNEDLETASPPESWTRFRKAIEGVDAVLFITPEYNRSTSAVLKNAIDVGSRPWGKSVWNGKPAAVISASPGAIGGFSANHHLRPGLAVLNMPLLPSPEMYLSNIGQVFDEHGALKSEPVRDLMTKFAAAFADWIERHAKA